MIAFSFRLTFSHLNVVFNFFWKLCFINLKINPFPGPFSFLDLSFVFPLCHLWFIINLHPYFILSIHKFHIVVSHIFQSFSSKNSFVRFGDYCCQMSGTNNQTHICRIELTTLLSRPIIKESPQPGSLLLGTIR